MKHLLLILISFIAIKSNLLSQTATQLTGFNNTDGFSKNIYDITRLNDQTAIINFTSPKTLWRTDGTKAGSYILHDWTNEYTYAFNNNILGVVNDKAIMLIPTDSTGKELWVSDGTIIGTHILVDFIPGKEGLIAPSNKTNTSIIINNECYFLSIIDKKYQLMKTDGSVNGTEIYMKDIVDVDYGVSSTDLPYLFQAGEYFYFIHAEQFYKIDYKNKTSIKVALKNGLDILDMESITDTSILFVVDNYNKPSLNTFNLNTNKIESLKVFSYSSGLYLKKILNKFNSSFYFCSDETPPNLYKTDGTIAGTKNIKVVEKQINNFIEYNNKLWFDGFENTFYAIFSIDQSDGVKKELDSQKFAGGAQKGFVLLDNNTFFISGSFIQTGFDWEPHIYNPFTTTLKKLDLNKNLGSYPKLVTKLKDHNYLFYANDDVWDGSLFLLEAYPTTTGNILENSDITVYPNPSISSWTLETKNLDALKTCTYKIIDVLGNELSTGNISNTVTNINASGFSKGIYFLEIQSKQAHNTIKLIKQ